MESLFLFILGALKITLLDLTLCGDNIGIIALATKNLPPQYAKKASLLGIAVAVSLIITFACFMTVVMKVQWLHIRLIGGLLLLKITWDFIKPGQEEEDADIKVGTRFWESVGIIILADISMSLDNVLAIAGAANGQVLLIIFGVSLNIPILFFGSRAVAYLMNKYPIAIYIGGAILAHTAFSMILEDSLVINRIPELVGLIFPWLMAAATFAYGIYIIKKAASEKLVFEGNVPVGECAVSKAEED